MKTYLVFKLPEEQPELESAQNGGKYFSMLWDIAQYRRQLYKYDERETVPKDELISELDRLLEDFNG